MRLQLRSKQHLRHKVLKQKKNQQALRPRNKSSAQISHIEFVSIAGQVVSRIDANSDNVVCNVVNFEQGMYFVRIYGEDHKAPVVSKFVKN